MNSTNTKFKLLKFYAPWCGPCKLVDPIVTKACQEKRIIVESINIDEVDEDVINSRSVRGVPTLLIVDQDGKEVARKTGLVHPGELEQWIDQFVA